MIAPAAHLAVPGPAEAASLQRYRDAWQAEYQHAMHCSRFAHGRSAECSRCLDTERERIEAGFALRHVRKGHHG
jgi:uncharacterized protein Usg